MKRKRKRRNLLPFFRDRRPAQITFIIFFLLPVLAALTVFVLMPVRQQVKQESAPAGRGHSPLPVAPSAELASRLAGLQLEEAYLQSIMDLAKKDSVMLSIDLRDSVLSILIKGIAARRCPITKFSMSHAIRHFAARDTLHSWLYPPFALQHEWATIPKAPIRIMDAPKDTIEASANAGQEITIEKNDVHFTMEFNRGLSVIVEQEQTPSWEGRKKKFHYDMERIFSEARRALDALRHGEWPQHPLRIELVVSREDAKAVYRSTPIKLQMALRVP